MTLLPGAPPGGLFQTFKLQIAIACEDGGGEKRLEQRAMLHGQPEAEPVPIVDVTVHVPVKIAARSRIGDMVPRREISATIAG